MNTNTLVTKLLGCSLLELDRSWWACRLNTGEWVCEARLHKDLVTGQERYFEWYDDLVANGDVLKITELWLLCPPNRLSPMGNTARLPIIEPGTAFEFKVASVSSNIVSSWRTPEAHIIGRVTNKENGECECFIWDDRYSVLSQPFKTNVYDFGTWRESMPPRGKLHLERIGLRI